MSAKADGEALNELDKQQAKEIVSADSNIHITALRDELGIPASNSSKSNSWSARKR